MEVWIPVLALVLVASVYVVRKVSNSGRVAFIESFRFHPALIDRVRRKRPELEDSQMGMVCDALQDFFIFNLQAGRKMVAMPSQVVDDLWHEFILFTKPYKHFCDRTFGRYLHHTPVEGMSSPTVAQDGIKRAWRLACAREGIDPNAPDRLPRLFAIDASMNIADGFHYTLNCKDNRTQAGGSAPYCASHIGCSSGCAGDTGSDSGGWGDSDGGSSCGSSCGGGGD